MASTRKRVYTESGLLPSQVGRISEVSGYENGYFALGDVRSDGRHATIKPPKFSARLGYGAPALPRDRP